MICYFQWRQYRSMLAVISCRMWWLRFRVFFSFFKTLSTIEKGYNLCYASSHIVLKYVIRNGSSNSSVLLMKRSTRGAHLSILNILWKSVYEWNFDFTNIWFLSSLFIYAHNSWNYICVASKRKKIDMQCENYCKSVIIFISFSIYTSVVSWQGSL